VTREDPARRLEAVELGHLQIHEYEVVVGACNGRHGLQAVLDDVRGVAVSLEQAQDELLIDGVVLCHEDPQGQGA
jgi:hypothetical protein